MPTVPGGDAGSLASHPADLHWAADAIYGTSQTLGAGPAMIRPVDDLLPGQVVVLDVIAEPGVLLPAAGEDGDEPAVAAGDRVKVGAGAQLAVPPVDRTRCVLPRAPLAETGPS